MKSATCFETGNEDRAAAADKCTAACGNRDVTVCAKGARGDAAARDVNRAACSKLGDVVDRAACRDIDIGITALNAIRSSPGKADRTPGGGHRNALIAGDRAGDKNIAV